MAKPLESNLTTFSDRSIKTKDERPHPSRHNRERYLHGYNLNNGYHQDPHNFKLGGIDKKRKSKERNGDDLRASIQNYSREFSERIGPSNGIRAGQPNYTGYSNNNNNNNNGGSDDDNNNNSNNNDGGIIMDNLQIVSRQGEDGSLETKVFAKKSNELPEHEKNQHLYKDRYHSSSRINLQENNKNTIDSTKQFNPPLAVSRWQSQRDSYDTRKRYTSEPDTYRNTISSYSQYQPSKKYSPYGLTSMRDHGKAMTYRQSPHHPDKSRITSERNSDHDFGKAESMRAEPARRGFTTMLREANHDGEANMTRGRRTHDGSMYNKSHDYHNQRRDFEKYDPSSEVAKSDIRSDYDRDRDYNANKARRAYRGEYYDPNFSRISWQSYNHGKTMTSGQGPDHRRSSWRDLREERFLNNQANFDNSNSNHLTYNSSQRAKLKYDNNFDESGGPNIRRHRSVCQECLKLNSSHNGNFNMNINNLTFADYEENISKENYRQDAYLLNNNNNNNNNSNDSNFQNFLNKDTQHIILKIKENCSKDNDHDGFSKLYKAVTLDLENLLT
jgi:hypothetical protein